MDRPYSDRDTRTMCLAVVLLISPVIAFSQSPSSLRPPAPTAASAQAQAAAPTHVAAPAPKPVSAMLQPALDSVRATLDGVRLDKWKKGSIRDEAGTNIDSIRNDLRTNMAQLLQQSDAAPGTISKLLPVSRHLDALYNVLLRVSEASRVSGPDDQAEQLQKALQSLGNARLALGDQLQGSAEALEKQVGDLKTTVQQQAAQKAVVPVPVALPCVPPPAKKTTARPKKPAARPATTSTPNATTPAKPNPGK